ncbi:hypothetical protein KL905_001005 [Ogataea polymorpha]|nr:hypothetical protein KL908_003934 [Ogataea polymorpha]KAG7901758.1 hypothetical protein KL935_001718 [Ogataea polymorpha]KAG7910276.1 hypothetical protein KL907_001167 [Ogataea polymorpha]KAG7918662.1 hypothetical protein KL927_002119 [Ogataea polymorpha]KAG7923787.1 hypothetical protein KL905_001005 [Ogataea polymorpha]
MDSQEVTVVFRPLNNCLINLPAPLINPFLANNILIQNIAVELNFRPSGAKKDTKWLVGWNGYFSSDPKTIEIDSVYASSLGLRESRKIVIRLSLSLPKIQSVELEPETSSDWELTEMYAQTVEDRFLNQVRCAVVGQKLAVYPSSSPNNVIKFVVKKIKSETDEIERGILVNDSELHIIPKVHRRDKQQSDGASRRRRSVSGRRSSQFDPVPSCLLRSISLPHYTFQHVNHSSANYEIYVNLDQNFINHQFKSIKYVQVSVITGPGTPAKASSVAEQTKNHDTGSSGSSRKNSSSVVDHKSVNGSVAQTDTEQRKVVAILVHDPLAPQRSAGVSPLLAIALGIEHRCGDMVCIEAAPQKYGTDVHTVVLHKIVTQTSTVNELAFKQDQDRQLKQAEANKELSAKFQEHFKRLNFTKCPITNGMKVPVIPDLLPQGGFLELRDGCQWALLGEKLPNFELGDERLKPESFVERQYEQKDLSIVGHKELIARMVRSVRHGHNCVLSGASGSGKTTLINEVAHRLVTLHGYYSKNINCETISNDNFHAIKTLLEEAVKEVNWHSPSVLVLENLDSLIPQEMEHGDSGLSRQVSEFLVNSLKVLTRERAISLLCSSKSKEALNATVFQTHLIQQEFSLKAPDKELRKELLRSFINDYNMDLEKEEILNDITVETEGYLPSDLKVLADRTFHDYISSKIDKDDFHLRASNFERALQGFVPSSLRGVKLQKSGVAWSDIGGLKDAKRVLLETLEWPTKYAPIFANCPLRLRSGILLYGYPGCGKTLLASAVVSQCGLNFISIKGPEILNKYIGASEQSIRELFDRAQSAKPCVLFFDEFDSIAPKRGHDSTGVTDRVVNQLLTQMDGAEGLDGVYVLAATSRPDLIDSALLRPGRLDKSILCDLPDYENRLDILQTVASKFHVSEECRLDHFARKLEGYSGADLQAFVYNAYLKAVHDNLDQLTHANEGTTERKIEFFSMLKNLQPSGNIAGKIDTICKNLHVTDLSSWDDAEQDSDRKPNQIVICNSHFETALEETKKSISNKELRNFARIYSQFVDGKREGHLPDGQASTDIGGRTTLM